MAPFGIYGNLKVKNRHFFPTHPDLMPSLGVILSEFPNEPYSPKTRLMGLSDAEERPRDLSLIRLITIPACDRQTDGHAMAIERCSIN